MTYHRIFNRSNTTGDTSGAGTEYPSIAPEFTQFFNGGSYCSIYSCLYSAFFLLLFVFLSFFFWWLYRLFFDSRMLVFLPTTRSNTNIIRDYRQIRWSIIPNSIRLILSKWVSYCCLTPSKQIFSYIMSSCISMRWWKCPLWTGPLLDFYSDISPKQQTAVMVVIA